MQIDLQRPLLKVWSESERAVDPDTTVARAREAARRLDVDLDITTEVHGEVFWTARMNMDFTAKLPAGLRGFRLAGKGPSERQCLASCAMEFVERFSLYTFSERHAGEVECIDVRTGEARKMAAWRGLLDTKCVAAGNYYEDAVLHALHELVETRLGRSCLWKPFKVVDLGMLLPALPEWVGNDIVLIKSPSDVPDFHHFTAVQYPADGQFDERRGPRIIRTEEHLFWQPTCDPKTHRSPNSGGAAGLNPALTAFRAMNEIFQFNPPASDRAPRRPLPPDVAVTDAEELRNCESECITTDIRLILDRLGEDTFVGVVDLTHPELEIPVVKLVSDWDPNRSLVEREMIGRFFELPRG